MKSNFAEYTGITNEDKVSLGFPHEKKMNSHFITAGGGYSLSKYTYIGFKRNSAEPWQSLPTEGPLKENAVDNPLSSSVSPRQWRASCEGEAAKRPI